MPIIIIIIIIIKIFMHIFTLFFRFLTTIETMLDKDIADNIAIGEYGAKEILKTVPNDAMVRVLTHCNTGSLATAGYGTALGVIRSLRKSGRLGLCYIKVVFIIDIIMHLNYYMLFFQNTYIAQKLGLTIKVQD